MKVSKLSSVSLIGIATSVAGVIVACGSSSNSSSPRLSAQGESCTTTADCASGLDCFSNVCFSVGSTMTTTDGGSGPDGSMTSSDGSSMMMQSGGGPQKLGQACAASSQCGSGLTCVPFASAVGGLCDYASFGVNPDAGGGTGKTCSGECTSAQDCCELPPPDEVSSATFSNYSDAGIYQGSTTVYPDQCAAILQALGGDASTPCSSLNPSNLNNSATSRMCYYYQTYCSSGCAANWACTNNSCVYTGACTVGSFSQMAGACAYYSRSGRYLSPTCTAAGDSGTMGSCAPTTTTCMTSTDCNGQTIADPGTLGDQGTVCAGGDCTCVSNKCYFSCTQDIDCASGFSCSTSTHLCTRATPTGCMTNDDCVSISVAGMGPNAKATCNSTSHVCQVPCSSDHDCSLSSGAVPALGRFSGYVCSGGICTEVSGSGDSCSTNTDCQGMGGGTVNMFCVAPPASSAQVESAISGGKGM